MKYNKSDLDLWKKEISPTINSGYLNWLKSRDDAKHIVTKKYTMLKRQTIYVSDEDDFTGLRVYSFPSDNEALMTYILENYLYKSNLPDNVKTKLWTDPSASPLQKRLAFSSILLSVFPSEDLWDVKFVQKANTSPHLHLKASFKFQDVPIWDFNLRISSNKAPVETVNFPSWNNILSLVDWDTISEINPDFKINKDPSSKLKYVLMSGEELEEDYLYYLSYIFHVISKNTDINFAALNANFYSVVISSIWYLLGRDEKQITVKRLIETINYLMDAAIKATGFILFRFPDYLDQELRNNLKDRSISSLFYRILSKLADQYNSYKVGLIEASNDTNYFANAYAMLDEENKPLFRVSALAAAFKYGASFGMNWIPLEKMILFLFLHEQFHAYRDDLYYYKNFLAKKAEDPDDPSIFDVSNYPEVARFTGNFVPSAMNIEFDQQFQETVEVVLFSGLSPRVVKQATQALRIMHIFRSYESGGNSGQLWAGLSAGDKSLNIEVSAIQSGDPGQSRKTSLADLVVFYKDEQNIDEKMLKSMALDIWMKPLFANFMWLLEKYCRQKGTWIQIEVPKEEI